MANRFSILSRILAAVVALSSSAGCFSMQKARINATGETHVHVSNYGWYLFHAIPLACGNANADGWAPWVLFRDDVSLDKTQARFMAYANNKGAQVNEIEYNGSESVMLNIPGLGLQLPIPYLLTYREIQLSGILSAPDGREADE